MKDSKTVQSIFNLWFWHFQTPSLQQFSNLYHATIAIVKYFNEEGKYDRKLEELSKLFFHPILVLKDRYPELKVTKNPVDWNVAQVEWCYFRDTRFKSKLGTEYFIDSMKLQETKKLTLSEMISVLSLFKSELFQIIIKILIDSKLNIFIQVGQMQDIEQVGGKDVV